LTEHDIFVHAFFVLWLSRDIHSTRNETKINSLGSYIIMHYSNIVSHCKSWWVIMTWLTRTRFAPWTISPLAGQRYAITDLHFDSSYSQLKLLDALNKHRHWCQWDVDEEMDFIFEQSCLWLTYAFLLQ